MITIGTPLLWSLFAAFVIVALLLDFYALNRQGSQKVSIRAATIWSLIWVAASFVFVGLLWWGLGGMGDDPAARAVANDKALEFITGYLVEKALAVDNIFVFLLLFTYFAVPAELQKRVLMIGILAALVLRAILILVGAWLIAQFHWIMYVFGAFLVFTGIKMWMATGEEPDLEANPALRWVRRRFTIAPDYDGERFFTRINGNGDGPHAAPSACCPPGGPQSALGRPGGRLVATPMLVVVLLVGIVDVVFAVDSIPAIFAITTDPFIVLTSNVFAILGLRAMYFLLAGMHDRFHLLPYGLAVVLVFIGAKMLLIDVYKIPVMWSLLGTAAILATSMILSLCIPAKPDHKPGAYPFQSRREDGKTPEA